ncbi:TetR family transcriptional regulator [Paenibacillus camerounensis]|uniref:TetR family transcriptional regulator n=1 Tax=Paenibacillus camerounensis TaxID=1243663 RepID=UPI0005A70171|nr:TetR family transcriptional regulator [Paenibacillus camerounensis]
MNKAGSFLSKTEILDAAEQTLRRFGPDKTSVTDVAKLLGVSHGTLYRHFPSKAALREAVTERWLEEQIILPLAELAEPEESDSLEQLRKYITRLSELKAHHAKQDGEMFKMYASVTEEASALIETHIARIIGQLSSIIRRGQEADQLSQAESASTLARALFYATARFHHPAHAYEWQSSLIGQDLKQLWELLARGLTAAARPHI